MLKRTMVLAAAGALATWQAPAQTTEEIVARHLEARGGLERIQAVESARISGKMGFAPGSEAPFTMEWKRPAQVRLELVFQGVTGVQAFDGKVGWSHMPFLGQDRPQRMAAEEVRQMEQQAGDLVEGPLVRYREKGHEVELLGREAVEGTEAYRLKLTLRNGNVVHLWIDAESHLEVRQQGEIEREGSVVETATVYGDYREVDGLVLPFRLATRVLGAPVHVPEQVLSIDSYALDPEIADERFTFPGAAPEPERGTQGGR